MLISRNVVLLHYFRLNHVILLCDRLNIFELAKITTCDNAIVFKTVMWHRMIKRAGEI